MTLSVQGISAGYRRRKIINQVSLSCVKPGSMLALLGPNGVGKSTFLKAIAGLLPYQGKVTLGGQDLSQLSSVQLARRVGYLPQALPQATSLVAYELVYSGCRAVRSDLSKGQIDRLIDDVFQTLGIRQLALQKMAEMSGGQRQMVGLAQVLVRKPELFLLDEPTSALDLHWQLSVLQSVSNMVKDTQAIALVASHDINLVLRFCDQLIVLSQSGVLTMGPAREVLTPEILAAAYDIEGRIETCSKGYPMVISDRPIINKRQGVHL